jgi:ADP-ribose pyrophosphatase YjhB (NUDIX family)
MHYPLKGRIGEVACFDGPTEVRATFGAFTLPVKEGKILLAKRDDKPSIPYPGWWNCLGGGANGNEASPLAVLGREFQEECLQEVAEVVGRVGRPLQAVLAPPKKAGDPLVVDTAEAYLVSFVGEPKLTDESREFGWFDFKGIRDELNIVGRDKTPFGRTLMFVLWGVSLAREPLFSGIVSGQTLRLMFPETRLVPGPDFQLVNDDRYLVRLTPEAGQLRLKVWHSLSLGPSANEHGVLPGDPLRLP